jgi:hypothetical protein
MPMQGDVIWILLDGVGALKTSHLALRSSLK